jgi:hypothetical protein
MFSRLILASTIGSLLLSPSSLTQQGTSTTAPCQAAAKTMTLFKYGLQWAQWTELEREIYLIGFVDGGSVYSDFMFQQPEPVRTKVFEQVAVKYDNDVLSPVITSLYADPANVYIRYDSTVLIARDKVSGKDVEPLLRHARAYDCGGSKK